ncbi:MAG: phosphoribosylformylglycinamidine synthase [Opitutales bacterium]|nr:phosphoribosylformylglycinamidine synthase [Opitutales bacterium]
MIRRLYVEKKANHRQAPKALLADIRDNLGIASLRGLRILNRYDVEGVPDELWQSAKHTIFSEPPLDEVYEDQDPWSASEKVFAVEYLPGQYDQRADSAEQCLRLLAEVDPKVHPAQVIVLDGDLSAEAFEKIKAYRINPVDSREADLAKPETLTRELPQPKPVARLENFASLDNAQLEQLHAELGLAMSTADLVFCQHYFANEAGRDPSLTEIRLLDTYWSDHCRHTTFLTEIESAHFDEGPLSQPLKQAWESYLAARREVYGERKDKPICLMDIALMGMKSLRRNGQLNDLEESEEVNAASIIVPIEIDGKSHEWLVMFKNETHNHPTEIEPFGGAATCLGGAIRDPLSGRSYVYQAMRVTGAGDPRQALADTLPGKLPQRKICLESAHGYSSYGNQIGLATGIVNEFYHPNYVAKRMEIGAVIAAAPREQVVRGTPEPGDIIVLVGGRTGRDGVGGATGSSKEHTETALENSAEVQKGDPPTERKLQRLFRNADVSRLIKRCNDFGAGGVSVAIGELAPSLDIDLDAVPLKYAGLDGTEIAVSESQERMAVVLDAEDVQTFVAASLKENLEAVPVAKVTDSGRLRMTWKGDTIVDIGRDFLDSNGVRQTTTVAVKAPDADSSPLHHAPSGGDLAELFKTQLGDLNVCSQKGLIERFDSSIGAGSALNPFGGCTRMTPAEAMCARLPVLSGKTSAGTLMAHGFDPEVASWSPFHGATLAVVDSLARIIASGGERSRTRLTLQEYFPRTRDDAYRWGLPFSALLGAWEAQRQLGTAAIGGKDSMSGSFQDLDVPPSLVSFAVCPLDLRNVVSPEFKCGCHPLYLLEVPLDDNLVPDWEILRKGYDQLSKWVRSGKVRAAAAVRKGGVGAALAKMSFGNRFGFSLSKEWEQPERLFGRKIGSIVIEASEALESDGFPLHTIGKTLHAPRVEWSGGSIDLDSLEKAWSEPLECVYPTQAEFPDGTPRYQLFEPHRRPRARLRTAKPKIIMPVFPGNNCEYDTQRAFEDCGAEVEVQVFRNQTHHDIEDSIQCLERGLNSSQILMIPGGFSSGDEPDGSGKFIATVFRNPRLADAVMNLIQNRDGLILGICNGFQALLKLGLLPYGEIRAQDAKSPTLAHNYIGRHISSYVRTKVVSKKSPWLSLCELGSEYWVAMSHGEGRFYGGENEIGDLFENDQVATQYVDSEGLPTHRLPENPNGSIHAIEGICSPCGRIYGKMGHSERAGRFIGSNVPGQKIQPIFASGVAYFRD